MSEAIVKMLNITR